MTKTKPVGLEGVIAFETQLSDISGERGSLCVRGLPIITFAQLGFERAFSLLFGGDAENHESLRQELGAGRVRAHESLPLVASALKQSDPMTALRAALCMMPPPSGSPRSQAAELAAALGVYWCAYNAQRERRTAPAPDPKASHVDDLARLFGATDGNVVRALEIYLTTVMEHGVNASTFAARTIASTDAAMRSAVVGGMCALEGRLHGGAPGPVLDMLDAVGMAERAPKWIADELAAGRRIMGMGHRVYRARDPRAEVLEPACRALAADNPRIALAHAVEKEAERQLAARHPDRPLRANVEFFTAILLEAVGVPREMFTATFAVGRVVGWCAHVDEQRRTGRLIRPRARYIGAAPS